MIIFTFVVWGLDGSWKGKYGGGGGEGEDGEEGENYHCHGKLYTVVQLTPWTSAHFKIISHRPSEN